MSIEEILNTDHFTALPEGALTENELKCQESDEEIERLPNISTLLRASEFIDLGIINDQATVQATSVTTTVQAMPATAIPATAIPHTSTPVPLTAQSEGDSEDDLPISKYLRNFLQQEETEFPQQDIPETQHVTDIPQQDVPQ